MAFMTGVMNYYHAFIAGRMANNIDSTELLEIHPDDVEEIDITWQMAMVVFRAKNFVKKTGRNKWETTYHELGWNKSKLIECKQPISFR
ncbi:hypothetical protein Hanom_Chr15g01365071 [Helianthus anomalus]